MAEAPHLLETAEGRRLRDASVDLWRRWGPYLSERQWGTVREDYSEHGDAWNYFPHEHARARAYRWGEDGIAGFSDDRLLWCLGVALWNGRDRMIKERLFGLTNGEGNHGEDVKEVYFYLDGLPTHSYMRMLYRYPQGAFPYEELIAANAKRGKADPEFEITDTGIFADQRYFDVVVEYAKAGPDDILMHVEIHNRGPDEALLHVIPQLWARNTWAWSGGARPSLTREAGMVRARHTEVMPLRLEIAEAADWLFCENETNRPRLFGTESPGPFKDGFEAYLLRGDRDAVRRDRGTKCGAHVRLAIPAGASRRLRLRLRRDEIASPPPAFADFDAILAARRADADEFYGALQRDIADADKRLVQRQAIAGLLWSKQFYAFDVRQWLEGDPNLPAPSERRRQGRNADWPHLTNADIILMPDKWEYPWYAAWDLAFHCVAMALVDPDFAKDQLLLLARAWYMHPNGQLPAYEWSFSDSNPPVHAWAAWRVYQMDLALTGKADTVFLERMIHKLIVNFTWWVNRKDRSDRNVFEGGFLGLDNIGIFDRSRPVPTGGTIDQSDGTAWMAMYTLNLLRIVLELAESNPVYQDLGTKFFQHFLFIAEAMGHMGATGTGLWDGRDEFFYDVLNLPDGSAVPLRVRSIVGLIPLFAVQVLSADLERKLPQFSAELEIFLRRRPDLAALISRWHQPGEGETHLLSLLRGHRMKCLLRRALDEDEFLSPFGVRALSRYHGEHPYRFESGGEKYSIGYEPGESQSGMFGGNSNWRGPIWLPVNYLLVESLYEFHRYYGEEFLVRFPSGGGAETTLAGIADALSERLSRLFLKDANGIRPAMAHDATSFGGAHSEDLVLFHEYFHGETGAGLGASHQTGWTALVALLLQPRVEHAQGSLPVAPPA